MAKRNQVTTELRISADAQLKNSRSFISQLEKIVDKFDFGDKINNQLVNAQSQLKNFNKALEKIQGKNVISDEELKNVVKAGKEIASLITKTEQLYSHLDNKELQKFSKEYINQVKAQEAAVAKIKNDYAAKTGKNFDKELANYDKLKAKIKELEKEQSNLSKNGISNLTAKKIEEVNKKLEEQKAKLIEIRKIQEQSSNTYSSTLDVESKKRGYKNYDEIKGIKTLSEDQIRKQLGTAKYKEQSNLISTIGREIRELEKNKQNTNTLDKEAVKLAKKYQIENVKGLNDLKQQLKIKKDILEVNKKDKSKLADEKAVTAQYKEQLRIAKDRKAIEDAAKAAELKTIQKASGGIYTSKASLSASASATNKSITNLAGQLTESGIETITNNAANIVAGRLDKLNNELAKANGDLSSIDETNKKLATQSERTADEQDIKEGTSAQINATNSDGQETRRQLGQKIDKLTLEDADKIKSTYNSYKALRFGEMSVDSLFPEDQIDVDSATYKTALKYENNIAMTDSQIQQLSKMEGQQLEKYAKEVLISIEDIQREGDVLLRNALNEIDLKAEKYKELLKIEEHKAGRKSSATKLKISSAKQFLNDYESNKNSLNNAHALAQGDFERQKKGIKAIIDGKINSFSQNKSEIEVYSEPANKLSTNIAKAAEQSQYLGSTFDDIKNKIGYFLSLNYVFDQMTRKISEAVQTTKEMDKDMTQIGLVLGKTSGQVWKNFNTYSQMAERLNTTTSQVTNSMKLFYQQGLNTSEVNKMVEASAIAAALGESTLAEASETLTSILNSYNLSANEALSVTDKISQIAIVSAADFGELSTAIEKVASSAASAGLDLDHMMGYLAKMIETTREAPTNIGTALKTIVANFTQFKEDPSGLGEEGTEINKVDKALKSVGISLTDTNGEVRDLGDVLDELGGIWESLNRNQRAYLATQIAGNRQQSRFYALMNDYERTLELVAEGSNSAGKAQQQFALYSNSLEAATNRLTNQWEKFFNDITKGNGLVATLTNSLTGLMKIANKIRPIGTILGLGEGIKLARSLVTTFDNLSSTIEGRKNLSSNFKDTRQIINDDLSLKNSEKKQKLEQATIDFNREKGKSLANLSKAQIKYVSSIERADRIQKVYNHKIEKMPKIMRPAASAITQVSTNTKKLWASIKLGANQVKTQLTSIVSHFAMLAAATIAFKAMSAAFEGVKSALNLNAEAHVENAEKASENADNINGLKLEYEQLAKKVNKTAEEQERLKEITEEITKIDSKLGQQLKDNVNNYEANIKAMEEYSNLQEKIAAQESSRAVRAETNKTHTLGMQLFDNDLWTSLLGSESDKELLKSNQQNQWRLLASNRGTENNLTDAQMSMLDKYTEYLLNTVESQGWSGMKMKYNTDDFDEEINNFIDGLKKITKIQQEAYTTFITELNSGESSLIELSEQLKTLDVPEEIKNNLSQQLTDTMTAIRNQIDSNGYIQDKDSAYKNALKYISPSELNKLFNPDNSSMTENESVIYKKNLANFIENLNLTREYSEAQKKGAEAVNNFVNNLSDVEFGMLKEIFFGLNSLNDSIEKTKKAFEGLQEKIDSSFLTGEASQTDIIKGILEDTLDIRDVKTMQGATGNILSIDITRQIAQIDSYIKQIESTFDVKIAQMQKDIDKYSPKTETRVRAMSGGRDNLGTETTTTYGFIEEKKALVYDNQLELAYQKKMLEEYERQKNERSNQIINKENELTERAGGDREGSYMSASKEELEQLKQWKTEESDLQAKIDATNNTIEVQEKTLHDLKQEQEGYNDLQTSLENNEEGLRDNLEQTVETLKAEQQQVINTKNAISEYLERKHKNQKENTTVFNEYGNFNQVINELDLMKEAFSAADGSVEGMISTINLLTSNSELADYLDETVDYTKFSQQAIQDASESMIAAKINNLDAEIAATETTIALIESRIAGQTAELKGEQQKTEGIKTEVGKVLSYEDSQTKAINATTQSESQSIEMSIANWATWSVQAQTAIQEVSAKFAEYVRKRNEESEQSVSAPSTKVNIGNVKGNTGQDTGLTDAQYKSNAEHFINQLNSKDTNNADDMSWLNSKLDQYKTQLNRLKALRGTYTQLQKGLGSYLAGDSKSGGSEDKFEPVIEKLEKFYNYLRQIEEIEAKLNRLREKRNLIDASKNYYIDDLEKENSLLREQQAIYNNYIRDQGSYLAELQSQIQAQFSDWAYFNEDGVVQVKQTEFTANSEAEQERLNTFLELIDLYQNEYNTREENINKLYEIESTQLENIQTMYDKILSRVTDITDELNRQKDLLDHDMTMSFSNIAKFDIMDDQMGVAVGGISNAQAYLNDFEKQVSDLNKEVKNGPFSELLLWDETLNQWRTNEEALQDPSIIAKYEKMGYTWQDIDIYIRSVAVKSQSINEAIKETTDSANEFAEVLKQLIDDRISIIQDFFGAATDELNKIFDTFNSKMEDIDNQNDLFGVSASALEEKYLTAVTAVAVLKQTLQSLRDNKGTILETIQKDYPEYIEMINGVAVVNKQAIEESTKLTEAQKSDLLQLYGILEASEDQITEMEDKLVDYFNTMMEMEREKRDAIIELKQSLHDELIARDQQEIDDLRSKYDKMSQLDNEYYSELSRRVSDARTLRDDRQQSANIGQMQAQLAVLKADNSGTYNSELISLQKQLNEALQAQADNEVTRELERIQREQQEREEDRQLTISAMENVLTFKDENSWYWQEAQRIWNEGPESVTGFLRASNEYANISDEQRAVEFENLTNSMNTAFTTLQTESGISDRISDGIVTEKSNEEQLKLDNVNSNLDFIQEQLGESGLAGKIDWSNSQTMSKLDSVIAGSNADALAITNKMQTLYTEKIGPGTEGVKNAITSYLGENSSIWKKLKETDDALDKTGLDMNSGFTDTVDAASNAATAITKCIETAKEEYINTDTRLYNWLNDKYAKDNAEKNSVDTGASTGATVKVPTTNGSGNSVSSTGGNGGGSNAASKPDLKIGTTVSVKPGTRWYYDSYGTNPSGTARGGRITYTNLKGSHPYNIEGLGWIRKQDIVGYSKGGYVDYTGIANVHGTQTEPEAFLNAKQTRLFEGLRDSLVRSSSNRTYDKKESEIAKEEYNIDNISIEVKQIADIDAVDKITRRVKEEIYKDATSNKNNMAVRRR